MARFRARFEPILASMLLASMLVRIAYVYVRAVSDPTFQHHALDSGYYMDWARSLAAGQGGPPGAFYLAPFYPYALWIFIEIFGENLALLYCLQQASIVGAAGLLALTGRRLVGEGAGLAAAALLLLYQPLMFFAARVIGEPLAIFLLVLSLYLASRATDRTAASAGFVAGVAALGRPNLLLVPAAWAAVEIWHRRWLRSALVVFGLALALTPAALRNAAVSGHFVPISSNAGITLYTGNAPGAEARGTQRPPGSTGKVATQQADATRMANRLSGREMDPVEADRWWARRAIEARLEDPVGTSKLLARRASLLISNAELSLAMAPAMDANLLRWLAPAPICLLFGLAMGGVVALGFRRTGGWPVWTALGACAVTPILFYVSSRYRLPAVAMLCLPAGAALHALSLGAPGVATTRKRLGLLVGALATIASLAVPVGESRSGEVASLLESAWALRRQGDYGQAEADLRRAADRHPGSVRVWIQLGDLLRVDGRPEEAEAAFRRAHAIDPASAEAAGGLGGLLVQIGRPGEAVPLLEQFLSTHASHPVGWNSLVAALWNSGQREKAREAAAMASSRGVRLEQQLIDLLGGAPPGGD